MSTLYTVRIEAGYGVRGDIYTVGNYIHIPIRGNSFGIGVGRDMECSWNLLSVQGPTTSLSNRQDWPHKVCLWNDETWQHIATPVLRPDGHAVGKLPMLPILESSTIILGGGK